MTGIVVVPGNPRAGSRTSALAVAVGEAIAGRLGAPQPQAIEVGSLGTGLLTPGAEAQPRQLLAELGADVIRPGLPVLEADLPESTTIAGKYAAAVDW